MTRWNHESEHLASPRESLAPRFDRSPVTTSITRPYSQVSAKESMVGETGERTDVREPGSSGRGGRRRGSLAMLAVLPVPLRLVIVTQFAFNVGFYLVVPFIAAHLAKDLLLAEWIIGLLLGLRTFSQQGMFFLGGALADRFGIKNTILVGCAIRICGFLTLAVADEVFGVMVGVILIGFAAALFSPAVESAIVAWAGDVEAGDATVSREEVIGLEMMASQLGSVVGPVLGGVLLVIPFRLTCLLAAGVFAVIMFAQVVWLPRRSRIGQATKVRESVGHALTNRRFLTFALIHCTCLVVYNQFYLAIPVELDRIGVPGADITWLFGLAAVLTVTLQLPVTRLVAHWSTARILGWGYALMAAGLLGVAAFAALPPLPGVLAFLPSVLFVIGLHVGQVLVMPAARGIVADLSGGQGLGTHLGMLASVGGLAVLLGSTGIGLLLPLAETPQLLAPVPWIVLAGLPVASCVAAVVFCRRGLDSPRQPEKPVRRLAMM